MPDAQNTAQSEASKKAVQSMSEQQEEKETWCYGELLLPYEQIHNILQLPNDWKVVAFNHITRLDQHFLRVALEHPSLPDMTSGRNPKDIPAWELRDMQEPELQILWEYGLDEYEREHRRFKSISIKEPLKTNNAYWHLKRNVRDLLERAIFDDNVEHKQWYLHRIADALDIPVDPFSERQGIDPTKDKD